MHRKGFAKTYSTNFVESLGHSWCLVFGAIRGRFENGWPVGNFLTVANNENPETFAELCGRMWQVFLIY